LTAQSLAQQVEEKTKELDQQYNLSEVAENTFENFGKKIQEVDQQYHIGESLNQMFAAAVNTGELARDVIVASTIHFFGVNDNSRICRNVYCRPHWNCRH
jgi:hypothetical protein